MEINGTWIEPSRLYSCEEAAEILTITTAALALHRHRRKGMPFYRIGAKSCRYMGKDIIAFIEAGRVEFVGRGKAKSAA